MISDKSILIINVQVHLYLYEFIDILAGKIDKNGIFLFEVFLGKP